MTPTYFLHTKILLDIRFFGVLLDENLGWKKHIKYNENKIVENLGFLYKAKHYLNKESLLALITEI